VGESVVCLRCRGLASAAACRSRPHFANAGFVGSVDEFVAGDYIGHLGAVTMDRGELERQEREFCRAFPDAHHVVEDLIAEGDRVFLRTTARAAHRAEFEGIFASSSARRTSSASRW
jgi:predicted ester cyclase